MIVLVVSGADRLWIRSARSRAGIVAEQAIGLVLHRVILRGVALTIAAP